MSCEVAATRKRLELRSVGCGRREERLMSSCGRRPRGERSDVGGGVSGVMSVIGVRFTVALLTSTMREEICSAVMNDVSLKERNIAVARRSSVPREKSKRNPRQCPYEPVARDMYSRLDNILEWTRTSRTMLKCDSL